LKPISSPYQFAFTIVDDTDHAQLENVRPIYNLLRDLKIFITKTVWPLHCDDPHNSDYKSHTLEDLDYAGWVRNLYEEGFEIALHGASAGSNSRSKTLRGLEKFELLLGKSPELHVNHANNRDNLYWGIDRFDSHLVRFTISVLKGRSRSIYKGHSPESEYFWGDIFSQKLRYCRNLSFVNQINSTKLNPTMPYFDPKRPYVKRWFSSCDAADPERFVKLLSPRNVDCLQEQGGVCIIYTHLGVGFTKNGTVIPSVEKTLRNLARKPGKFLPASRLLDELCEETGNYSAPVLPERERLSMEYKWLLLKLISRGKS
jgi:hypothetical protein